MRRGFGWGKMLMTGDFEGANVQRMDIFIGGNVGGWDTTLGRNTKRCEVVMV